MQEATDNLCNMRFNLCEVRLFIKKLGKIKMKLTQNEFVPYEIYPIQNGKFDLV